MRTIVSCIWKELPIWLIIASQDCWFYFLLNVLEKDGKSWWSTSHLHSNNSQQKNYLLTLKKEHWPQKTTREKCLETKQCLCDRINQMQHAIPAAREAQRVIAMTPLFWEKVVLGGDVIRTARMLFKPSASRPHLTQCWWIWPATKNWNHQKTVFLKCHLPDSSKKKTANISPSKPWPLENSPSPLLASLNTTISIGTFQW